MRGLIAILFFAVAVAILALGARPLWENIVQVKTERDAFNSAILRINELRRVRDSLIQTYNSISQTDIRRVKKILPDTVSSGVFLVELSNLASENGLLLKSTDVSTAVRPGAPIIRGVNQRYGEVGLKFVVSGPYERFGAFLRQLEKSLRIVDVTALSFSGSGQPGVSIDFSVEAKSYQQP